MFHAIHFWIQDDNDIADELRTLHVARDSCMVERQVHCFMLLEKKDGCEINNMVERWVER